MSAHHYWNHAHLAACYGHLGEDEMAQEHLKTCAAEVPDPAIHGYRRIEANLVNPEYLEPLLQGPRKAGLPEWADHRS